MPSMRAGVLQVVAVLAACISLYASFRVARVIAGERARGLPGVPRLQYNAAPREIKFDNTQATLQTHPSPTVIHSDIAGEPSDWKHIAPKQPDSSSKWTGDVSKPQQRASVAAGAVPPDTNSNRGPHTPSSPQCWNHFDFGMLEDWDRNGQLFCTPRGLNLSASVMDQHPSREIYDIVAPFINEKDSWLLCRKTVDTHLPPATAPHTICDGQNIILDVTKMSPADCPVYRPHYKCDGDPVFYHYAPGAVRGNCDKQDAFVLGAFPRDHLMDIFTSFEVATAEDVQRVTPAAAPITLFVTRERAEHANPFHATTDLINAFYILHLAGVIDGYSGERTNMEKVQVVLLDEQTGPFEDVFWRRVFSPSHPLQRPAQMKAYNKPVQLYKRALFVPPGYSNLLLSHVMEESDCHETSLLLRSYRKFFLAGLQLDSAIPESRPEGSIRVTFVSRRPYQKHGIDHAFMGRQIDNEDQLMEILQTYSSRITFQRVDFALIDTLDQIRIVADTEILIAMHGAALTYPLYMPSHAAVIEFWPKLGDMWRCFEHIATMSGLIYERWANPDPSRFREDPKGDYTRIDTVAFKDMFDSVVARVESRRAALPTRPTLPLGSG